MFILRLAVEAFNLAESELSDDLTGNVDDKPLNYPPYPPSLPQYSVDPIIFQFGYKRKDINIDASDGHRRLFCPKRLRLDPLAEVISILHGSLPYREKSQNEARRHVCANQPKNFRLASKKRSPLNVSFQNMNRGEPSHHSTSVDQRLAAHFREQLLAIQSMWTAPKEEPLDLSFKQPKLKLTSDNNFCSIRKLVELQPDDDSKGRRNTFPLSKPSEAKHVLPHNIEILMNSVRLFNDLKPNLVDIINWTDQIKTESTGQQSLQRRRKLSQLM